MEKGTAEAKAADTSIKDVTQKVNEVRGFGWPLGWDFGDERTIPQSPCKGWRAVGAWALKFLGWVLTAAAISLGAPFWFDLLNRFMVVRSTVKPTQKSPPEGSADPR